MADSDPRATADRLLTLAARTPLDEEEAASLADAALDSGREAEAVAAVAAAARRYGDHAQLWQWAGLLHRSLNQHQAALAAFDRAAALAPAEARIAHGRARTALEAGLPALAMFERARSLAPADGDVLLGRAAARCAEGDARGALRELDALLAASPGWYAGHELSARLRWMHGEHDNFVVSLDRALDIAPRDPALWRSLLILLVHANRFEEALAAGRRARALIGDHIVIDANEAAALSELGRAAEADAIYDRIGGLDDISLAVRHIRHMLRNGRVDAAARRAEPLAYGAGGNLVWPYLSLAWRLLEDQRWNWLEGDPNLVGIFDLADRLPPLDALADALRALHRSTHQPLDQSLRGGTQTDGMLFQRIEPEIQSLRAAVVEAVRAHIEQLPALDARHPVLRHRRDLSPRFSGSWSVRLTDAGHHANHNHPAGWLSSAFYVALPETGADEPPDAGWLGLGEPQVELGLNLPPIRMVEPKPGRLVLFPSTMWHGTRPFAAGERLTVAFDVAAPFP